MANDEHVAILKKGVAAWNAWRSENLNIRPDLGKADLREAKLGKAPLEYPFGVNLVQANLSGADLRGLASRLWPWWTLTLQALTLPAVTSMAYRRGV